MALPGLGLWAWRVPLTHFPAREWAAGSLVLAVMTAFLAWVLPEPLALGVLASVALGMSPLAPQAWSVEGGAWVAWLIFFAASLGAMRLKDGRSVWAVGCVLWAAASVSLPGVWWAALLFAWAPPPLEKGKSWARWAALAAAAALAVSAVARGRFGFAYPATVLEGYDFLFTKGFVAPALLAWLGAAFVGKKSWIPWWVSQLVGWTLAWFWAAGRGPAWWSPEAMGLLWLTAAFFGVAALRRDLMDRSWHADVLWVALAIALAAAY